MRNNLDWSTPNSHSGFLEFGATLGLVGVLILVAAIADAGARAWRAWRPWIDHSDDWRLAFLLCVVLIDLVEVPLYDSGAFWVLLVTAAVTDRNRVASRPTPVGRGR